MSMIDRLRALVSAHPDCCQEVPLSRSAIGDPALPGGASGFPISALRLRDPIAAGAPERIPVLIVAGIHGREWAPPDALIEWAELLVEARTHREAIVYPKFQAGGVTYADDDHPAGSPYVVPLEVVDRIFATFELILLPMANPDGRWFAMQQFREDPVNGLWRKNRAALPDSSCVGVDLNRNFPVGWDPKVYFRDPVARSRADSSDGKCSFVYRGAGPGSEIETRNVMKLIVDYKPRGFVDIHMTGRSITHPWALERNQVDKRTQSLYNPAWDAGGSEPGRDGFAAGGYGEFVWPDLLDRMRAVGELMAREVVTSAGTSSVAKRRSRYAVMQSAGSQGRDETYPGCTDDYAFSRQFEQPDKFRSCIAYTIECGMQLSQNPDNEFEDEGGFTPHYRDVRPKITREVHAALFGMLKPAGQWPPPDPPPGQP